MNGSVNSLNESKMTLRYDATAMAFCIGMLVVALVIGYFHQIGTYGETDFFGAYVEQAERILAGQPYTYGHNPPGYMLVLAAVSLVTGDLFVAGKIISAFAAALFGWMTYLLFKALFDARIAFATTVLLLLALIPDSWNVLAATDLLAVVALMVCVWVVLREPHPTLGACFFGGLFAGAAYLVRSPTIFVIPGIGVSLLFVNRNGESLRIRLARASIYLCGFLLITCPWLIYNWKTNGNPIASSAHLQIAAHFYEPQAETLGTTLHQFKSRFRSLSDVLLHDPARVLSVYSRDILYWNPKRLFVEGMGFPAFLFAGAGFLLLLRDLSKRMITFLLVCLLGYLFAALVGFQLRYYIFLRPLLFLSVAYFLFHEYVIAQPKQKPVFNNKIAWLLFIMLAAFGIKDAYKTTRDIMGQEPGHLIEIAKFLKDRSSSNDIIIVRKPHLGYLTGLEATFVIATDVDEWLASARRIGARYIVYSDYAAKLWPGLTSLRDPDKLPGDFKLIYHHEPTRTLIYEIVPRNS